MSDTKIRQVRGEPYRRFLARLQDVRAKAHAVGCERRARDDDFAAGWGDCVRFKVPSRLCNPPPVLRLILAMTPSARRRQPGEGTGHSMARVPP